MIYCFSYKYISFRFMDYYFRRESASNVQLRGFPEQNGSINCIYYIISILVFMKNITATLGYFLFLNVFQFHSNVYWKRLNIWLCVITPSCLHNTIPDSHINKRKGAETKEHDEPFFVIEEKHNFIAKGVSVHECYAQLNTLILMQDRDKWTSLIFMKADSPLITAATNLHCCKTNYL